MMGGLTDERSTPALAFVGVLSLSCVLSGVVSSWLPAPLVIAVVGMAAVTAGVGIAGRLATHRRPSAQPAASPGIRVQVGHSDGRAIARLLFYLGMASLGQLTLRPAFATTASDFLFLGALAATLATPRKGLPASHGWSPQLYLGIALLALGAVLSMFGAEHRAAAALVTIKFLYLTAVWFWLAAQLLVTRQHVRFATTCWVGSVAVSGLVAVMQFFTGSWLPDVASAWTRMPGTGQHVNDLGGMAAVALLPALTLGGGRLRDAFRVVAGGAIFAGLLLSGAVAGLLAAVASLIAWVAIERAYLRGVLLALALVAGGVFLYGTAADAAVPTPLSRLQEVTRARGDPQSTAWSRIETFEAAMNRIAASPLIGTGMSAEDAVTSTGYVVHNIVLGPFDRAGLFGGLGILLILGAITRSGLTTVRGAAADERALACALFSAFFAFVVFGMSAPILFQRYGWVAAALVHANYWRMRSEQGTAPLGEKPR